MDDITKKVIDYAANHGVTYTREQWAVICASQNHVAEVAADLDRRIQERREAEEFDADMVRLKWLRARVVAMEEAVGTKPCGPSVYDQLVDELGAPQ